MVWNGNLAGRLLLDYYFTTFIVKIFPNVYTTMVNEQLIGLHAIYGTV